MNRRSTDQSDFIHVRKSDIAPAWLVSTLQAQVTELQAENSTLRAQLAK